MTARQSASPPTAAAIGGFPMSADGLPLAAGCCLSPHVRHSATPPRHPDNGRRWMPGLLLVGSPVARLLVLVRWRRRQRGTVHGALDLFGCGFHQAFWVTCFTECARAGGFAPESSPAGGAGCLPFFTARRLLLARALSIISACTLSVRMVRLRFIASPRRCWWAVLLRRPVYLLTCGRASVPDAAVILPCN
jgi:hypothetical protein